MVRAVVFLGFVFSRENQFCILLVLWVHWVAELAAAGVKLFGHHAIRYYSEVSHTRDAVDGAGKLITKDCITIEYAVEYCFSSYFAAPSRDMPPS